MLPSLIRYAYTRSGARVEPLRVGQRGGRGKAALTDRQPKPPRYIVQASGGGAKGRLRLIRQLCTSLIIHGALRTTLHRAKGTQRRMAAYIRWAKRGTEVCRRKARVNLLGSKDLAMGILFNQLGKRFKDSPSGFTTIHELGPRPSDTALMAIIQIRGSGTDYGYHYAAMVAGRQMAIQGQGFTDSASRALAEAWRKTALSTVAVASNSSLDELSRRARTALQTPVIAGNGTHLHPAYADLPKTTQQKIVRALRGRSAKEALAFDELMRYHCDRTLALAKQPGFDGLEASKDEGDAISDVYEDDLPAIQGEAEWAKEAAAVPSRVDLVGAQIMPSRASAGSSWMRPALRLVKGQYDVPSMRGSRPRL